MQVTVLINPNNLQKCAMMCYDIKRFMFADIFIYLIKDKCKYYPHLSRYDFDLRTNKQD